MSAKILHLAAFFTVCGLSPAFGQEVSLFAQPDETTTPVANVELSAGAVENQTPVVNPQKQAVGWYWGQYTGPFRGFVRSGDLGTQERPPLGTLVFAAPDESSAVITSISEGDDSGPFASHNSNFYEVTLNKRIGVYVNPSLSAQSLDVVQRPPERIQVLDPAENTGALSRGPDTPPRYHATLPSSDSGTATTASDDSILDAETEAAEEGLAGSAPATPPSIPSPAETTAPPADTPAHAESLPPPPTATQPPPIPTASDTSITLKGELAESRRGFLILRSPYPYQIRDIDGNRIAWVDLSRAILSRPLPELLNATVTVYGEWKSSEDEAEMVLEVRTIRPSF